MVDLSVFIFCFMQHIVPRNFVFCKGGFDMNNYRRTFLMLEIISIVVTVISIVVTIISIAVTKKSMDDDKSVHTKSNHSPDQK